MAKVDHHRWGDERRHVLVEEKIKTLVIQKWLMMRRDVIDKARS